MSDSSITRYEMWADEVGDLMGVTAVNVDTEERLAISCTWLWVSLADHQQAMKAQAKEIEHMKDILRDLYFTEPGELPEAVIKVCDEVGI